MGYTKGPWTARDDDGTGTMPCVLSEHITEYGNFYVAQCHVYADAQLIAAAPDLLEACKAIASRLDRWRFKTGIQAGPKGIDSDYPELKELIDAAIAKAEGK